MSLRLHLSHHQTRQGLLYQQIKIKLTQPDRIIDPQDLVNLELPPGIDTTKGVIISGRAPIWLYSYLVHECHPTAWVACFDPRLGAIVVSTHSRQTTIGQVIPIADLWEAAPAIARRSDAALCPALMVVGPPDSGKSVFSYAVFQALLPESPDVYLQRANWDGEGNYVLELPDHDDPEEFKATNKGQLTDRFFPYHAQSILNLRRQKSLVIVDVGGKVQPEKLPLLEACSHYLIISSQPETITSWHEFCHARGNLTPISVIHSVLHECEIFHQGEPYLEMTCGAWNREHPRSLPRPVLERVRALLLQREPA
ncbi:CRISPR-associated ring nuclease Crn3/Csx3 [Pantanalinema rosaneae CENA516]|uniref:CRISPR-associated ring nuclease Crn3/Csx3 n=1 Tax=Pantanalinema rosaneae TaxID=1620701 RepID=UPI003D6FA7E2